MILKRYTGISAIVAGAVLTALLGVGCQSKTATASGGGANGSSGPAPVAKPGAVIGANNPPPGQANHMSPEMQAQLQHYQSMGKK